MRALRTKSLSTKVTEREYATIVALAGNQRVSEWVRQLVLRAATPDPLQIVLAELLALRKILLNLHFGVASGNMPRVEELRRLIEQADHDKDG